MADPVAGQCAAGFSLLVRRRHGEAGTCPPERMRSPDVSRRSRSGGGSTLTIEDAAARSEAIFLIRNTNYIVYGEKTETGGLIKLSDVAAGEGGFVIHGENA